MVVLFPNSNIYTHVYISFREKELAAVKINAADVDIIANELEVCVFLILSCSKQVPFCVIFVVM